MSVASLLSPEVAGERREADGRSLSIVVTPADFLGWGGGIDFVRLVVNGLAHAPAGAIGTLRIALPDAARMPLLARVRRRLHHAARAALGKPSGRLDLATRLQALDDALASVEREPERLPYDGTYTGLARQIGRDGRTVLMPAFNSLRVSSPLPWVGYCPDLQHRRLPHLFPREEARARDRVFARVLREARCVIVNARSVAADLRDAYAPFAARVVALPFAPAPPRRWFDESPAAARARHGIGERYFMVSNQFWRHKDHRTAFRAFRLFVDAVDDGSFQLVCTGSTDDFRDADHFPSLQRELAALRLERQVRILGHVPKAEQIALLRGAAAVVQPTLFEGGPGGGAVHDAVALGIPAIVSDIPVNREVDCGDVRFFPVGAAEALATRMIECAVERAPPPSPTVLLAQGERRLARLGAALVAAARVALGHERAGDREYACGEPGARS